jgi:ribonuclease P protein component
MIWLDNATGHPRIGLIVPKFQSNAVARNRLRRQLKEIWRRDLQAELPPGDLVVRARREAYRAGFDALQAELRHWSERVNGKNSVNGERSEQRER